MKLQDIVVDDAIIIGLKATERDDAIAEMVDALIECGTVKKSHRKAFIEAILHRESRGSTGFGRGVAVPHVKHKNVKTMTVAVATSETGVEFNALDGEPVQSIFLLLSPEDKPEDHLDAMEAIFTSLQQDTFRRFLTQAKEVDDIRTLLKEADARTATH